MEALRIAILSVQFVHAAASDIRIHQKSAPHEKQEALPKMRECSQEFVKATFAKSICVCPCMYDVYVCMCECARECVSICVCAFMGCFFSVCVCVCECVCVLSSNFSRIFCYCIRYFRTPSIDVVIFTADSLITPNSIHKAFSNVLARDNICMGHRRSDPSLSHQNDNSFYVDCVKGVLVAQTCSVTIPRCWQSGLDATRRDRFLEKQTGDCCGQVRNCPRLRLTHAHK